MTTSEESTRALQPFVERLYEDEKLRSNLTDAAAEIALAWATRQLEDALQGAAPGAREEVLRRRLDDTFARVSPALRAINTLSQERHTLAADTFRARLRALVSPREPQPAVTAGIDALVVERRTLSDTEFVERIVALLDEDNNVLATGASGSLQGRPFTQEQGRAGQGHAFSRFMGRTRCLTLAALLVGLLLCGCLLFGLLFLRRALPGDRGPRAPATEPRISATTTPAPSTAWYSLYFTTPLYPDDPTLHGGSIDENLTDFIRSASISVDAAIYELDLLNVTGALIEAHERGLRVRVVTDINSLEDPGENGSFLELEEAGIVIVGGNPNAIMHNKFVVVDEREVWTGSWNFTENGTYRNNNHAIRIASPQLARNYTATFEKMWLDGAFGASREAGGMFSRLTIQGIPVLNYFAPEDQVAERIAAHLAQAEETIDFMAFAFTDDLIGETMLARTDAGVVVRGVFETTGSDTEFSEYGLMRASGLEVYQDGNPYLMHHKVIIIDRRTVIFGSYNFSRNADESNDENLLIIEDATLAGAFLREFERVRFRARNPLGD
ncbi:MAG: phospholipase D-like domain-containing protein [Ardenticatenaceae bacterium]